MLFPLKRCVGAAARCGGVFSAAQMPPNDHCKVVRIPQAAARLLFARSSSTTWCQLVIF